RRLRRDAVRVLHARPGHVRRRAAPRGPPARRRGDPRGHGGQHLPLRRVRQHRRGGTEVAALMHGFGFAAPGRTDEALRLASPDSAYLAGGTTLVDLMKLDVLTPGQVIDINDLPLRGIRSGPGGLRVGALERMSDVAAHDAVPPVVAQAL